MMKIDNEELLIGLIGDTHIPSRGAEIPKFIINDFKEKNIDYLFHLGDFTKPEVYRNLQETFGEDKVIGIIGNMDGHKLRNILPETREFNLFGHKIFMTHGMGGPHNIIKRLNERYDLSKYEIVIFGHTHHPFNERGKDGKLYLNPGSPTDKVFTDVNSYGYLTISKEKIKPDIIYL
ncbi:MAG: metallophosphoesterase family protein [Promethearchaeota archaeon]